jgi:iron complex outermembrane recepter protein
MRVILFSLTFLVAFSFHFTGQTRTDANVFGHVVNAETGEHIPFINLVIEGTRIGTITDVSGHYILTNVPEGRHKLLAVGLGYKTTSVEFEISPNQSVEVDIEVKYEGINLEELVFTASPTQSGFRYQPDQVYTGESLQRRAEASFGEMLNGEPGVAMRSMGSMPARPVIRGLDGDRILILENGERMGDISETSADHSIALDPLATSRVEVVRGPASLLYGSSALGGVINLMTTDIPDNWDPGSSGIFSLQGATMNKMGAGFGRFTYGTDNFSTSGRFAFRQSGDITTPDGLLPGTSMQNYDGAIGLGFKNTSLHGGISLSLSGQNYEIPDNVDDPNEGIEIRLKRQALQGRFAFERKGFLDKGQVRFNAARMFQEEVEYEIVGGIPDEEIGLEYNKLSFSSTLTMQHKPFGFLDRGAMGVNLHGHEMQMGGEEIFTPGERRVSLGVFTFQEIPVSRIMRLQFGLRLDFQYTGALSNEIFPDISSSRSAVNYSGSFGFNHRPIEGLEVGGQFARSHRNPSVEELFANGIHLGAGVYEIGDNTLKDEVGQGVDLFFRWDKGILQFELAGFVNYFRNFIIFEPTGNIDFGSGLPIFQYEGDEARLLGGEFSLSVQPVKKLKMGIGLDYVDGRRIKNGRQYIPFIPPFRLHTDLEYDFGSFWLGAKTQMVTTQNKVAPEEDITEGYVLLGMSAGYRVNAAGRHVIILRGDNLLNTRYRDHLSRIEDRNFPMPGRNISLAYRWFF